MVGHVHARNEGALGRSGQTLTAPCCDRVVGTASVYPVSRHQNRSRPVSITERGLVAEEPPTQCVSTRVSCVHILAYTCRRNSAVPYAYYYLSRLAHRDDDIKLSWPY